MPQEIERKFLVANDGWRAGADKGRRLRQGYLAMTDRVTVRIRIEDAVEAFLTIKSGRAGLSRLEFEYPLPLRDAEILSSLCQGSTVEKTRFDVIHAGRTWEVDVFSGDNEGLVVAEVELEREDDKVELPSWVGRELTGDARYYSARLSRFPYRVWAAMVAGDA